jgi:shikimate kinase
MNFYDSDEEIEKRTGVDIGWVYDLEGEEGFRRREVAIIIELANLPHTVLATGGGSVMAPEVQETLKKNGVIIFLDVSLEYQHNRTVNESRRPLLRVDNRDEVIEQLYEELEPVYTVLGDYRVLTDNRSVKAVAEDIMQWLGNTSRE